MTYKNSFHLPALILAASLSLGACSGPNMGGYASNGDTVKRADVRMVRLAYPIKAEDDKTDSVSIQTVKDIQKFLLDIQLDYGDTLLLDPGDGVSMNRIEDIQSRLSDVGLKVGSVGVYGMKPADGVITLYVERYTAEIPECEYWSQSAKASRDSNQHSPNFGCANNAALAAMVANPRDLTTGQTARRHTGSAVKAIQALTGGADGGSSASANPLAGLMQ